MSLLAFSSIEIKAALSEVMKMFFDLCTSDEADINGEIARRIWFRRNMVVHGGEFLHPNDLILSATTSISDYKGAMATETIMQEPESISIPLGIPSWRPPSSGFYKANWDTALNSKSKKMGFGCIIRDFFGKSQNSSFVGCSGGT
jgi:hypothetical protein